MNDFTYIDKNIINKERFLSGVKNKEINLYSDELLTKMSAFDYSFVPFVTFATTPFFKSKRHNEIVMALSYLLTFDGNVTVVKNNLGLTLILLEKDNGEKQIYDIDKGLVFAYNTYLELFNTTLIEVIDSSEIKTYFTSNPCISYEIPTCNSKRIVLTDLSISNYKLGQNDTDARLSAAINDYLQVVVESKKEKALKRKQIYR